MDLYIKTEQFQNKVLNFFVILMFYGNLHQNTTISEQSSEFLVILLNYGLMHQIEAISEQSSKFLCNTDEL